MHLETGAGSSALASKFSGGEERRETGGGLAYIALAAAAPGATSVKVNFLFNCVYSAHFFLRLLPPRFYPEEEEKWKNCIFIFSFSGGKIPLPL